MQFAGWTSKGVRRSRRTFAISCIAMLVTAGTAARSAEPTDLGPVPELKPLATAALTPPADKIDTEAALPQPLARADMERYGRIFALQRDGNWRSADAAIATLSDRLLMGTVLAQRYLHPTAYRSKYAELKAWLDLYPDHPDAPKIYALA